MDILVEQLRGCLSAPLLVFGIVAEPLFGPLLVYGIVDERFLALYRATVTILSGLQALCPALR